MSEGGGVNMFKIKEKHQQEVLPEFPFYTRTYGGNLKMYFKNTSDNLIYSMEFAYYNGAEELGTECNNYLQLLDISKGGLLRDIRKNDEIFVNVIMTIEL